MNCDSTGPSASDETIARLQIIMERREGLIDVKKANLRTAPRLNCDKPQSSPHGMKLFPESRLRRELVFVDRLSSSPKAGHFV